MQCTVVVKKNINKVLNSFYYGFALFVVINQGWNLPSTDELHIYWAWPPYICSYYLFIPITVVRIWKYVKKNE